MVEIKETKPCQRELTFRIPAEIMEEELAQVYRRLARSQQIPGFRAGKAPRSVLEIRFGKEARAEALENRMVQSYSEAVKEHNLDVVGRPIFGDPDWKGKQPLVFKAVVDVAPALELKNYREIRLIKRKPRLESEEVERALESLRERSATFEVVEGRTLREGDYALVDYRKLGDKEAEWQENALIEIRPDSPGGLSEKLIGMERGETGKVVIKPPPAGEGKKGSSPEVEFQVRLKEIKVKRLPELTDELASHWGDFKNLEGVREKLQETILKQKEDNSRRFLEEQVVASLLKKNSFTLPPSTLSRLEKDYYDKMRRYRLSSEEGKAKAGEEEELRKQARESAEKDLRLIFILEEIARREKLEVDPKILGEEISSAARQHGLDPAEYRKQLEEKGEVAILKSRLLRRRAMDFLITEAKIKEG